MLGGRLLAVGRSCLQRRSSCTINKFSTPQTQHRLQGVRSFALQAGVETSEGSQLQGRSGFLFRVLSSGKKKLQGKSYLLAFAATTGLGAGLFVVLADAGQDVPSSSPPKKKLVILGTGWGGMSFLKSLDSSLYDVRVVSPRNYFVFTPLLPSVTSGTVEARSITEPIRRIIKKRDVQFHEAECTKIDAANKKVICRDVSDVKCRGKEEFELEYDCLVISVGAISNTFNTKGVEQYCHFLKEIEDAERIRETIVDCFETASLPHLSEEDRFFSLIPTSTHLLLRH